MKENGKVMVILVELTYTLFLDFQFATDGLSIVSLFFWESDPLLWVYALAKKKKKKTTKICLFVVGATQFIKLC